jgi:hypothetical protein
MTTLRSQPRLSTDTQETWNLYTLSSLTKEGLDMYVKGCAFPTPTQLHNFVQERPQAVEGEAPQDLDAEAKGTT